MKRLIVAAAALMITAGCARGPKAIAETDDLETWLRTSPQAEQWRGGELRQIGWGKTSSRHLLVAGKTTENQLWYFNNEESEGILSITARSRGDRLQITDLRTDFLRLTPPE